MSQIGQSSRDLPPAPVPPSSPGGFGPRWAVLGIFIILAFAAIAHGRDFLMPLSFAVLLFFVFAPVRRRLDRLGVPSFVTASAITAGLVGILIGIGVVLSGPASDMMSNAPAMTRRIEVKFDNLKEAMRSLQDFTDKLDAIANTTGDEPAPPPSVTSSLPKEDLAAPAGATETVQTGPAPEAQSGMAARPDGAQDHARPEDQQAEDKPKHDMGVDSTNIIMSVLKSTPALGGQMMFVVLLLFFMIASGDLMYLKIVQSFATLGQKRRAYSALREIEDSLGNYLGTITVINAGLGVAIGVAMWLWGMPAPIMFGVLAFLLNYIPYIGLMSGAVLATAVALVSMPGFFNPAMVGLTYVALSSIEGQLITPYFVSRRLEMNTVVVFLTIALWAWLWSIVGMIVAVPMLVVMRVLCDHIPGMERVGNFLGGERPAPLGPEGAEVRGEDGLRESGDEAESAAVTGRMAV